MNPEAKASGGIRCASAQSWHFRKVGVVVEVVVWAMDHVTMRKRDGRDDRHTSYFTIRYDIRGDCHCGMSFFFISLVFDHC